MQIYFVVIAGIFELVIEMYHVCNGLKLRYNVCNIDSSFWKLKVDNLIETSVKCKATFLYLVYLIYKLLLTTYLFIKTQFSDDI